MSPSTPHAQRTGRSEVPQYTLRLRGEHLARVLWSLPFPVPCAPHPRVYWQPPSVRSEPLEFTEPSTLPAY